MPERIHTRFGDDDNSSVQLTPSQGKKRKRREVIDSTRNDFSPSKDNHLKKDLGSKLSTVPRNGEVRNISLSDKARTSGKHVKLNGVFHKSSGSSKPLLEKRNKLLITRKQLPIWPHADKIRNGLHGSKNVMFLVGETGSGKSTQVPQFLLDESWCTGCIAITQPRRVAAISLARRVADEVGTPLGSASPASKVGYSVRFDVSVSPSTRIKFLTEGTLLQEMLRDPWLKQYSVVVVDEVHERSVNVDLILGFLRNLLTGDQKGRKGKPLKVVVMSATADVHSLFRFFNAPYDPINGIPSSQHHADGSEMSWSGISSAEDELPSNHSLKNSRPNGNGIQTPISEASSIEKLGSDRISVCFIKGRQYEVQTTYLSEHTLDFVEDALKAVFKLHTQEPLPGDILVFLTGQDTVESLERLVNDYASIMDPKYPKILTLPLFAALSQAAQQKVFQPAPPRTRKIILSTNIAETSVTVAGVRFVVDSGKVKVKHFRNRLGLDSLLVKPVSKSSAIQRQGRAGREAPGKCYRLYTEKDYLSLEKETTPEILRCDLAQAILAMKARGIDDIVNFPFLDHPPRESLEKALLQLLQLGALNESGSISESGKKIAKLPLTPALGRILVEAADPDKNCLADIIDIVSCLSVENIFLNLVAEEKKEAAEEPRRELYRRDGDHLTMLAAVKGYAAEQTDRKAWSEKYFVSHRAMQAVMDTRKQLLAQCAILGLKNTAIEETTDTSQSEIQNTAILQCLLCGFAQNTARLMPDGSYRTLVGNQTVAIHPSSVLFGKKVEAIVFSEFIFTTRSFARGVSAVRLGWIDEVVAGM
ncbi:putative ATP-dependent RNA helicase [Tothia fuscella]|uniref:RNA helicase n=1 Tax=Tothia fuscella TaxID=1048955 RepID=A0A9P4NYR8_9PEZI|nr:putative ATP-dependent RNA helicase [Tothia fuscella]